jgi:hypothetical protein
MFGVAGQQRHGAVEVGRGGFGGADRADQRLGHEVDVEFDCGVGRDDQRFLVQRGAAAARRDAQAVAAGRHVLDHEPTRARDRGLLRTPAAEHAEAAAPTATAAFGAGDGVVAAHELDLEAAGRGAVVHHRAGDAADLRSRHGRVELGCLTAAHRDVGDQLVGEQLRSELAHQFLR